MDRPRFEPMPDRLRAVIDPRLGPAERVLAWFEPDLDDRLRFGRGLVVLTDRRLIDLSPDGPPREWPLDEPETLRARERGGLGVLEVVGSSGRLARWHYTARVGPAAHAMADRFDRFRRDGEVEPEAPGSEEEEERVVASAETPRVWALVRLLSFSRPHAWSIALGFILTLATTAAGLIPPYLTMPLLDDVLIPYQNQVAQVSARADLSAEARRDELERVREANEARFARVPWLLAGLGGAAVAAWLLGWLQGYVMAWVSDLISADLRNQTFEHLVRLSLDYFGGKRTGDLIARLSNDTDRICNFLSDNLVDFATDCLMILGTAAILLTIDPVLAAVTLASFPFIGWLVFLARDRLRRGFEQGGQAWSEMTSVLADTIPGIRVVKAFAQERREIARFRQSNDRILQAAKRVNSIWTFFWPMIAFLNQLGLLIIWTVGAWRVYDHRITVGVLTAFLTYIARFYTRLESMSRMMSTTQRAATSAGRLFEILDRVPKVPDPPHPATLGKIRGELTFRRVGFRYGNRTVLHEIDLEVRPGEMIGLVGPSGAGKSTLVNLVCRFYDPTEGSIRIDGVDLRRLAVEDYRRHIGIVLQEPFLFFGTVAENVAYGRPEATEAEVIAASRAAKAHEFVLRLADGYDSLVGERGQSLSGGERQRISIARALLIDPAILILDEATSSVDTETEREIQEALDNLVRGRTTIAIAHRLSTLRKADRLVVLEHGRVAEIGHHRDLLRTSGAYARLHRAQLELTTGATATATAAAASATATAVPSAPPRREKPARGVSSSQPAGAEGRAERRGSSPGPPGPPGGVSDLHLDPFGRLVATSLDGRRVVGVEPVRAFPISAPDRWVALCDARGREVALIEDPSRLPDEARSLLADELAVREFVPTILRIVRVAKETTPPGWIVETDRGPTRFSVEGEDHIRRLGPGRLLIADTNGLRYQVPDVEALDASSRRHLERYL